MKCISIFKCNPQIEVIDKSHCSLEDVPNFQNYSRSLEELFLDANKLTTLNDNVFRLTKLRRFSFSDNAIQDIPPDIAKLVNLVEIDGSRNKIQAIPEQIKFLRGLQICDFSANTIERLPAGLVQLKNLTCLTLNYCIIKYLPDDFGQLTSLESLELRENELEGLPPSIAGLENLKKLDIGRNLISELPDDIGRLKKLEYLLVDGNRLETIPPKIGKLENLQCLDLSQQGEEDWIQDTLIRRDALRHLPEEIGGLVSLTDLHLSENELEFLPDGIRSLKNLSIFKADRNYLTELNPNIGGCTSLQELVLTKNRISRLPSSIGSLLDLRSVNIDDNYIRELPTQIGNLKSLGILSLRNNMLTSLPNEIGNLESIRVMDLSGNRLEYLPVSIASLNLKALWLSQNQAQPLPKLQIDELHPSGTKIFTCYLLPQQSENVDDEEQHRNQDADPSQWDHQRQAAVSFDTAAIDDDLDKDAQFVRHNTPHPKELKARHQKLLDNVANSRSDLKGVDNASFSLADANHLHANNINNNLSGKNHGYQDQIPNMNTTTYQHLNYDSNGLPEVPMDISRPLSVSNTMGGKIEAFRETSAPIQDYQRFPDDRNIKRVNGSIDTSTKQYQRKAADYRNSTVQSNLNSDSDFYVLDIVVKRSPHHKPGLGLSIAGGKDTPPFKDNDEGIFVSKVTRGGPAEAADVRTGDKILAVNDNIFYDGITHQKAVEIFKKIKADFKEFSIRVLRDPNYEFSNDEQEADQHSLRGAHDEGRVTMTSSKDEKNSVSQSTFSRTYTVPIKTEATGPGNSTQNLRQYLMKDSEKVKKNASTLPPGMSLTDNSITSRSNIIYTTLVKDYKHDLGLELENRGDENDSRSTTWSNIVISHIKPNSIASRDGKLQVDDRLLSINGADVTGIDLDRIMLMLEGTERFIRIVVSRGDGDDPLGIALRNMPTRPSLGSWFSSTSNMSHRPSLIESYQRPTFGSVSSLSKHQPQAVGSNKPPKPPKPSYLATKDQEDSATPVTATDSDDPVAKPRNRSGLALSSAGDHEASMSDAEKRAVWRRERMKSIEDDVEMAKLIAEAQRRRREEK